jgi:DNA polymerase epsilon subunit 2
VTGKGSAIVIGLSVTRRKRVFPKSVVGEAHIIEPKTFVLLFGKQLMFDCSTILRHTADCWTDTLRNMEERDSVMTPQAHAPLSKATSTTKDPIPSSSPAFATPAYPIASRPAREPIRPPPAFTKPATPAVLPILLPPATLRPLAFRTITKKHSLTITSSSLQSLANFIGKHCGSGWREEGLAERILDEVAKAWKRNSGGVILDDTPGKKLVDTLKQLESCMSCGRIDVGRLSRSNSGIGGNVLYQRPSPISREDSFGLSGLDVEEDLQKIMSDDESTSSQKDARSYLKVISAFTQPRLAYSTTKKSLEMITTPPSLFPLPSHRTAFFRDRYNLIHQRLMRNESFQTPSSTTAKSSRSLQHSSSTMATVQQAYKITPIANLLGRTGSFHLLLGLLAIAPTTGELALADLTGSITVDLRSARPVPEDGAWFCPGMIVLVEGMYEEDGSNTGGGVGGMIGGRFFGWSIGGPPAERRDVTLCTNGSSNDGSSSILSAGAGFGWVDFLGVGSERAQGKSMRRIQQRILGNGQGDEKGRKRRTKIALLGECQLDSPRTLEAIRKILATYTVTDSLADTPLSIVLMGNFASKAAMAGADSGAGSIEYKEHFNALASVLAEFPSTLSSTTLIFVPGDNDPWASAFSAGAASPLPRDKVPDIFTLRIRRAVNNANVEAGKVNGTGEAVWISNPARISVFGPVEDIVLFRDDMTGRLRRSAITFEKPGDDEAEEGVQMDGGTAEQNTTTIPLNPNHNQRHGHEEMNLDPSIHEAESHLPLTPNQNDKQQQSNPSSSDAPARKLIKTLLDQSLLSPFPLSKRPILWDYASTLQLYPLPTALVLADAEAAAFAITYEGCHVMNPGRVVDELGAEGRRGGVAKWVEYDIRRRTGEVKEIRL